MVGKTNAQHVSLTLLSSTTIQNKKEPKRNQKIFTLPKDIHLLKVNISFTNHNQQCLVTLRGDRSPFCMYMELSDYMNAITQSVKNNELDCAISQTSLYIILVNYY